MVVWAAALVVATVTSFRSFRVPGGRCHLLSRVYRFGGCGSASGAHVSFFSLCLPPFYDCLLSLGDKLTVHVCVGVVLDRYNNGGWVESRKKKKKMRLRVCKK